MTTATKTIPKRKTVIRRLSLRESLDLPLAMIVITLFAIGLLMIYSASWQFAINQGFSGYRVVLRQALIGLAGMVGIVILTFIDYHSYQKYVVWGMGVVILLCLGVLAFGTETQFGARRGLIGGSVQPSEFAKLAVIVYLSFWLQSKKETLHKWSYGFIPLLSIISVIALLIFFQPDISAAITIILLGGIMFFIAGGKFSQILIVLCVVAALGVLIFYISDTASSRVIDYWNGLQDPQNASDHVKWSLEALVNGGIFGVGIGRINDPNSLACRLPQQTQFLLSSPRKPALLAGSPSSVYSSHCSGGGCISPTRHTMTSVNGSPVGSRSGSSLKRSSTSVFYSTFFPLPETRFL